MAGKDVEQSAKFDRRKNAGLHHLALDVAAEIELIGLSAKIRNYPAVAIEFMPELVGQGPRKHMMFQNLAGYGWKLHGMENKFSICTFRGDPATRKRVSVKAWLDG